MKGTRVEVEITGVAHGGVFVARHEGRVFFVSDAIPGETVLAEVTDDSKPSFWRADTVAVLAPSEHRRTHVWDAASLDREPADRAGGAEFGHIRLAHQRELKRQVIADSFSRMARIETDVVVEPLPSGRLRSADPGTAETGLDASSSSTVQPTDVADDDGAGWRTRLRLHVAEDGTPGPFAARTHRVVSVSSVPLAVAEAQALAPLNKRFPGSEFVDIVVPSTGDPYVVAGDGARQRGRSEVRIVERVGDRDFRLDLGGFWQVHRHAAAVLTAAVQDAVDEFLFDENAPNLDLYGGVGLFAAAIGDRFGDATRITTVESDPTATDHARHNLADLARATAVTGRVERYLQKLRTTSAATERSGLSRATVILDPPRAGAGKSVVSEVAELKAAQLVYVACDPVALARDTSLFEKQGYELRKLRAFDLFPNTHHVEAVASFVRRGAED